MNHFGTSNRAKTHEEQLEINIYMELEVEGSVKKGQIWRKTIKPKHD